MLPPSTVLRTQHPRPSISFTQNPNPDDWVGDGNHMTCIREQTMMKTRSKTKAATLPVYPFHLEKTMNIMENVHIHDNGKPIVEGKGKGINVTHRYPSMKNTNNVDPLFGSKFKDSEKAVIVSSAPVVSKKYNEKEVVTPISFGAMKKARGSRFQPLLRTWSEVEGADDELQTNSSGCPLPYNKKRKCSSKGSVKKHTTPQDLFEQQNAYFKEIDEYELIIEEVE